jgi:hypothetical protein
MLADRGLVVLLFDDDDDDELHCLKAVSPDSGEPTFYIAWCILS